MPKYELPPLPYDYAALEPHIDTQTMQIHHDKHHAAYVNNLNAALESYPDLQTKSPEALVRDLNSLPEAVRTAVRNQGGGVVNHTIFWQIMGPKAGGEPTGDLANAIKSAFGDFAAFKDQFTKAAMGQFGSGWAWLVLDGTGVMKITALPNQNSPLSDGQSPILCVDVWEHAYYLKYQNRRADYLTAWWNVVNWAAVAERYAKARK
jgi:Fe-Mn family superoxide dismutase